jgi:hypothetical protein
MNGLIKQMASDIINRFGRSNVRASTDGSWSIA